MSNNVLMAPGVLVLLCAAAAACIGLVFLVRFLVRHKEWRAPLALLAALLSLAGLGALIIVPLIYFRVSSRTLAEPDTTPAATVSAPAAPPAPSFEYLHAWTDKYPPRTGAFPEWVARDDLRQPPYETILVAGTSLFFAKTDAQDRVAGFSDFQPTGAQAAAQAWECLKSRLEGRVRARCALLKPRELVPSPTSLGLRIIAGIGRELDVRRTSLAPAAFEDEIDVAGLGNVYRAALYIEAVGRNVEAIAAAVLQNAGLEEQRAQEELRQARAARVQEGKRWAYCIGGALFLLIIITSVYLFLNAHTKGYYAWPLRIVAFVMYVAAVGAFVLFFRRFTGV